MDSEAADEVAKAIVNAQEFYPDEPLWVLEEKGTFLVKNGNRRCAAVKALQDPEKYNLNLPKTSLKKLPVLVYKSQKDLDQRIRLKHTSNLFRQWGRIAKALEVYRLFTSGSSHDSMKDIDSQPSSLIKLASFVFAIKARYNN